MQGGKAKILKELERQILPLQGYKPVLDRDGVRVDLGPVNAAFPNSVFPSGAVHEFVCRSDEDVAASSGFISAIAGVLMKRGGILLWVGRRNRIFPPALKTYGVDPDKIIFVDTNHEKETLWVMEEALKCEGLSVVTAEVNELSFNASRRLQLCVEKSGVTGFVLQRTHKNIQTTTCIARWQIRSLPSVNLYEIPGIGYTQWQIELLKVRNGVPGLFRLMWMDGKFHRVDPVISLTAVLHRKTG